MMMHWFSDISEHGESMMGHPKADEAINFQKYST